jgi:hypothetical protein
MCNYKSLVLTPNIGVNWCEVEEHHTILERLGIKDESSTPAAVAFLLLEVGEGRMDNYELDDPPTRLPLWYSDHEREYKTKVERLLKLINPVEAKRKFLYDEYEAKRKLLYDEYLAKRKPLYDEYEAKRKLLYDEYEAKHKLLYDELTTIEGFVGAVAADVR